MSEKKTSIRSTKLRTLLRRVLAGEENITVNNARLFLEAICDQPEPAICIQRLAGSLQGCSALQSSLSFDTSPAFLDGPIAALLRYLEAPELKTICGGEVLRQVIGRIVDTPLAWDALVEAARSDQLTGPGYAAFSWLLLQLVSLPAERAITYTPIAHDEKIQKQLFGSRDLQVRLRARRIVYIVNTITAEHAAAADGPGGRHDNDFSDFRKISILPTPDELTSKDPFLPRASQVSDRLKSPDGLAFHVDSQFRLLREDMLRDLREELQAALMGTKGRRKAFCVEHLGLAGINADGRQPWSLQLRCTEDLPQLPKKSTAARKEFLKDNPKFLKHESVACLIADGDVVMLGTLVREEGLLAQKPPVLCLQIPEAAMEKALTRSKIAKNIKLVQLSTAMFAYEPVLRQLKEIRELPLGEEILRWERGKRLVTPGYQLTGEMVQFAEILEKTPSHDLSGVLQLSHRTRLDKSQAACFLAGLRQRVSMIQGPPGTGKSFIGSLIAKAIHDHSDQNILLVCYTHHALDQFLEDLLNLGVPESSIVRLGSTMKATLRTSALSLEQARQSAKLRYEQFQLLDLLKKRLAEEESSLNEAFNSFQQAQFSKPEILEHLEFRSDGAPFYNAFEVTEESGNMGRVGRKGRAIDRFYLVDRWCRGKDAGIFQKQRGSAFRAVWDMRPVDRLKALNEWKEEMLRERLAVVRDAGTAYNATLNQINAVYMERDLIVMRQKRIVACTTTAAAKYVQALQSTAPGVLLLEEAGEILESHVLTALGPDIKQLVLIGDHKQLRPKVHYDLSVEKGNGYDLNLSLFERLVIQGYPHNVLSQQHRMRPELSAFVRQLTYPDLIDAPRTKSRPNLRGFQDDVMFVNHNEGEMDMVDVPDWRDTTSISSKKNLFEAKMALKCVRYLGQQGYRTDDIAVLTPYLGQLRLLLDELGKDNDPVLNDLDSHDLVRAGLMPAASANLGKPRIRISTIDNFQGDESNIVVASLTRSNSHRDIGFMASPERLNVLLSRARDALILIGDAETFTGSGKGGKLWQRTMAMFKAGKHVYDGLPVRCERHPDRKVLLLRPEDFESNCPDGGCTEPCGTVLACGLHKCPQYCHQLYDHSKMACQGVIESKCANSHLRRRRCCDPQPSTCPICDFEEEKREKELETGLEAQNERDQAQLQHAAKIADLDLQIRLARDRAMDVRTAAERALALEQKRRDLDGARRLAEQAQATSTRGNGVSDSRGTVRAAASAGRVNGRPLPEQGLRDASQADERRVRDAESQSEKEWDRQKRVEGASNDAIDALMRLTGLEDVKAKFLCIKAQMETSARQGVDVKRERLGIVMLGNPGTGKTTVARLYAQFLVSIGALAGKELVETTGASLANEGVSGAKKKIESVLKAGGGAIFLDEAYQLTSGKNYGGAAILDYLLAEIEERVGKAVFIFAGYSKEMEKFFEHNPGLDSRLPHRLHFPDYTDKELLIMLGRLVERRYGGRAELEDGPGGLFARILIRRLGRNRGKEGYGNARALENAWSKVAARQADRLQKERACGSNPDDLLFNKEDLIGPEPSRAIQNSPAWKKLQSMIGLRAVKKSAETLVDRIQLNYNRELSEKPPIEVSLNRVFLGPPGTGKTTVGKLYASILADLGLLSKREAVFKTPADFVGHALGESEKKTKDILNAAEGKTAVVDTIVAEVQSTPGEDRCVLLLGYNEQMADMFENSNPGLARRFPMNYAFQFEDFNNQELREILDLKLKEQGLEATEDAKTVAIELLSRMRDRPNFGNAGEVENLISHAKESEQKRSSSADFARSGPDVIFLPQDFDDDFDRAKDSAASFQKLFADVVGCEKLIRKLQSYQQIVRNVRARSRDPREHIPFNYIFKGPPGTGKTTIARKMAELFYEVGILSTKDYLECSASDLIGQDVLKKSLGKVLFVDEAYRLCDGEFGKEAVKELVDSLTKPQFMGKLVVILAGYSRDIDNLLRINPGLSSRFPEEVVFENMSPQECLTLLERQLKVSGIEVTRNVWDAKSDKYLEIVGFFKELSSLPSWGNGRDVKTLSNADSTVSALTATSKDICQALASMLEQQSARCTSTGSNTVSQSIHEKSRACTSTAGPPSSLNTRIDTISSVAELKAKQYQDVGHSSPRRDPGVSDATWKQLQVDMATDEAVRKNSLDTVASLNRDLEPLQEREAASSKEMRKLQESAMEVSQDRDEEELQNRKRAQEEERLQNLAIKRARQEVEERLKKAQEEEERRRQEEAKVQKKLRDMGVCPMGYRWIKQSSGYRCAGGSHFVSNAQIGI
ncbi:P-loop containing nucleoside triphosphate hydrolase protein [Macrophomina phaseolina]|uniref:P-loop containing nucleoside triphosphate hydrolase protein n=1 Tax=Macrophomina phaseolina TaxID=35725 RepID=A0ABQ8FTM5_9PEZI|nr:P-loop containing nucleoside triphosphate hydrolase protein [Macrophomina phaseolina]